jgi:hypothetical protein
MLRIETFAPAPMHRTEHLLATALGPRTHSDR